MLFKISKIKIISLVFSLIVLVFLLSLILNIESWNRNFATAAGPKLVTNPGPHPTDPTNYPEPVLDFGEVYMNETNRLRVLICNFTDDGSNLTLTPIIINSPFSYSQNFSNTIIPTSDTVNKGVCDSLDDPKDNFGTPAILIVSFTPLNSTEFTDTFTISTSGGNQVIRLKGKGIDKTQVDRDAIWVQFKQGNIYAIGDIYGEKANSPRSQATYRIITGKDISNFQSDQGYLEEDSFISSFPDVNNNFTTAIGSVDVDGLIIDIGGGENKYGYEIENLSGGYIGVFIQNPANLGYSICPGDLVVGDILFKNGDATNSGVDLYAIKGDVYIIGDMYYATDKPGRIENLASIGWIVLKRKDESAWPVDCKNREGGNVYIVDVNNLTISNGYIVGVDETQFVLDTNVDFSKISYCGETFQKPGWNFFDLDLDDSISGIEDELGWDDDYFHGLEDLGLPVYDYCVENGFDPNLLIPLYEINASVSDRKMTVAPVHLVGTYYVEGEFRTGKAKLPLVIEGVVMARSIHLEREPINTSPGVTDKPSELFIYDGRAILNPPPGFRELINERFNFSLVRP